MATHENKKEHSGYLSLRIPKTLHEALASEALEQGVSLNSYIAHLLSFRFGVEMGKRHAASQHELRNNEALIEEQKSAASITIADDDEEIISLQSSSKNRLFY